jgi:hypothetical protein
MVEILAVSKVTENDRAAARALRELLADLSGFWFHPEDDGPLCQALARHRIEAERCLMEKLAPLAVGHRLKQDNLEGGGGAALLPQAIEPLCRFTDQALSTRGSDRDHVTSSLRTGQWWAKDSGQRPANQQSR